jgi:hypothetical protein
MNGFLVFSSPALSGLLKYGCFFSRMILHGSRAPCRTNASSVSAAVRHRHSTCALMTDAAIPANCAKRYDGERPYPAHRPKAFAVRRTPSRAWSFRSHLRRTIDERAPFNRAKGSIPAPLVETPWPERYRSSRPIDAYRGFASGLSANLLCRSYGKSKPAGSSRFAEWPGYWRRAVLRRARGGGLDADASERSSV